MSSEEEQGIIEAVRNGNRDAFEALVHQYQKPIYNVVYRMLRDREESWDVTQTVFLKSFEKIHQYDPGRKFFSWLCRIAINESIDRHSRRPPEVAAAELNDADAELASEGSTSDSEPDVEAQREELGKGLEAALMRLDNDHRSVVVLKHVGGMSYEDISATLEVSEKTVKSRLYSARQKLRGRLKRDAYL